MIGRVNDILLYRELIGRGVSDYMVAPFDVLDLVRAVSHLYTADASQPVGRLIAVTGRERAVSEPRRSRITSPGPLPAVSTSRP